MSYAGILECILMKKFGHRVSESSGSPDELVGGFDRVGEDAMGAITTSANSSDQYVRTRDLQSRHMDANRPRASTNVAYMLTPSTCLLVF